MGQTLGVESRSAICPVYVGRDDALRRLAAPPEQGTITTIAGPAGVGKSRLAAEALRLAEERGLSRLVGQCAPDATTPYAPFVGALRRRTRSLGDGELAALFDGPTVLSAALLPEVASVVGSPVQAPRQEDLFAALWQLLRRLARPGGCVLLLEDLHWADVESLRLLSYLGRELEDLDVWIVGTYRSDELHRRHPLTGVLAELSRARLLDEIMLEPLGREDVRRMVSSILDDTTVGDEFIDALLERTTGNPFFIEETLKVLLERGDIYREAGDWARRELTDIEMPESVRDTLLARTRTLQEADLDLLRLAALAGDQLEPAVLCRAAGVDQDRLDDLIALGIGLQLLGERREGPRVGYVFRHALTREAFADELVGPTRARAHGRLAEALRAAHADDPDAVAASLAHHYAQAGATAEAIDFSLRAARRAVRASALEEAARQYERALHMMDTNAPERLGVLLEAADAILDAPDRRLALAFAEEARDLARARRDPGGEARALCVFRAELWESGDTPGAVALMREAHALARQADAATEALVLARLTRMLALADQADRAADLITRGIELAEKTGDYGSLSALYGTRMMVAFHGAEFDDALRAGLEATRRGGDGRTERNLLTNAGYISLWTGELGEARRWLEQAVELYRRFAPRDHYAEAGYWWLLALSGEYDEALAGAIRLREDKNVPTRIVALTAEYEVTEQRDEARAAGVAEELWSLAQRTGESQRSIPALSARARNLMFSGDTGAAGPLFWELVEATRTATGRGSHWLFSPDFASALHDDGQREELGRWAQAVHALTAGDPTPHNLAADALVSGYLAATGDEIEAARIAFGTAADRYRAMGAPARAAEALLGLANLEWRADRAEPSAESARAALDLASRIGALRIERRAADTARRAETPPVLATLLLTDIVSSTERLSAVGDRAWSSVLARHHSLVRRELQRFNGREIDTTGDGFLAMFDSPAQGVRCALAVRDSLASSGIDVRAGLHTGEVQLFGDKVVGLAVHIAARVSAAAGSGEVLVSRTVRDLVAGSGLSFADRGTRTLKGVEGEWQLFAVES